MRLWLDGVNEVGKLYRVLNKEDWDIISDYVPVAFVRVEFDCKAPNIADGVLEMRLAAWNSIENELCLQRCHEIPVRY